MKWWGVLISFLLGVGVGITGYIVVNKITNNKSQITKENIVVEKPLLKYTIENLSNRAYKSEIVLDQVIDDKKLYKVQKFHFESDGKRVNGLAHLPEGNGTFPVIVQFRGYAPTEGYESGYGTKHSAEMFAANGFISLAPDFLGHGGSASPSADIWEGRFETYTTAMNLLSAVSHWSLADNQKIGLWGHSNGGHIALVVAEISKKAYPMVLWAPVSEGFPYSVLYFMNENSDEDRDLRQSLAEFEKVYDYKLFNPMNYFENIQAKILLQQGGADESVPQKWSDNLYSKLKKLGKEINYEVYPGADHNLAPAWSKAVAGDVAFFKQMMAK